MRWWSEVWSHCSGQQKAPPVRHAVTHEAFLACLAGLKRDSQEPESQCLNPVQAALAVVPGTSAAYSLTDYPQQCSGLGRTLARIAHPAQP